MEVISKYIKAVMMRYATPGKFVIVEGKLFFTEFCVDFFSRNSVTKIFLPFKIKQCDIDLEESL